MNEKSSKCKDVLNRDIAQLSKILAFVISWLVHVLKSMFLVCFIYSLKNVSFSESNTLFITIVIKQ